jgi:hypothetical protein
MKRNVALYIVDVLLFIFSIIVVITGVIKFPGLLPILKIDPFSLPQAEITFLHDWIGIVLIILTLIHLALNWKWIQAMTNKLINRRIFLVWLIGIFSIAGIAAVIGSYNRSQNETIISIDQIETSSNEVEEDGMNIVENTQPVEMSHIRIEEIGSFEFDPKDVKAVRGDVFKEGFFSIFDILVHLEETGQVKMNYDYSEELGTHIIRDINGLENWWYVAYYDGGWPENNVWRMDLYPYKDRTSIQLKQINTDQIQAIYATFAEEVRRTQSDNGKIIIPEVIISGINTTQVFENVSVSPHNLRDDYFLEGTITAIDVIQSLSDGGLITHKLNWYESIGSAGIVKDYFVDEINEDKSVGRCGFVYEVGNVVFAGFRGNHIHIPSDIRVLQTTPEYVEYFWICI